LAQDTNISELGLPPQELVLSCAPKERKNAWKV